MEAKAIKKQTAFRLNENSLNRLKEGGKKEADPT